MILMRYFCYFSPISLQKYILCVLISMHFKRVPTTTVYAFTKKEIKIHGLQSEDYKIASLCACRGMCGNKEYNPCHAE